MNNISKSDMFQLTSPYSKSVTSRSQNLVARGLELAKVLRMDLSVEKLQDRAEYYYRRGLSWDEKGDFDKATEDFKKAIALNSGFAQAHLAMGNIFLKLAYFDEAINEYGKAIEIDPNLAEAYRNRGEVIYQHGEVLWNDDTWLRRYRSDKKKAIEVDPNMADWYRDDELCLNIRTRDIEKNPRCALAYYWRAEYWMPSFDEIAIPDYSRAISINPRFALAYYKRALFRSESGFEDDKIRVIEDLNKAILINPCFGTAYSFRGESWSIVGRDNIDKAIADFSKSIELKHEVAWAYMFRGKCWFEKNELEKSVEDFTRSIEIDPTLSSGIAYLYRSRALGKNGNPFSAFLDLSHFKALYPSQSEYQKNLISEIESLIS